MNSKQVFTLTFNVILLLLCLFGIGWSFHRSFKNSDDRAKLIVKWLITLATLVFMWTVVLPTVAQGGYAAAFGGVPMAAVSGLVLAILWRRNIAEIVANPFGNLYDGGTQEVEARAFYSRAEKLRQRGEYHEAIVEARKELEKFPDDFAGQWLIADVYANNLHDLQSAEITIQKILTQPQHSPGQITAALHALADWHLKLAQDPDSARLALEQIIERFSETSFAQTASQRIAHLASADHMLTALNRPALELKHFNSYAHLENEMALRDKTLPSDAPARAADCLRQLEKHPLDHEPREKLATIYAEDYLRLDLAADQLEQLIAQPNQPPRQVVRWLNLLADFQIKIGNDVSSALKTIRRISELFPNSAAAEHSILRIEYLRLQAKRNETSQSMKLVSYDKDLGLKKPAA